MNEAILNAQFGLLVFPHPEINDNLYNIWRKIPHFPLKNHFKAPALFFACVFNLTHGGFKWIFAGGELVIVHNAPAWLCIPNCVAQEILTSLWERHYNPIELPFIIQSECLHITQN